MDRSRADDLLRQVEDLRDRIEEIRDLVFWSVGLHFLMTLMVLVGLIVFK